MTHLKDANLQGANLNDADLEDGVLEKANLTGASLLDARLVDADLEYVNLSGGSLVGADLEGARLTWANLRDADLKRAYLQRADLTGARFINANLQRVDLRYADLAHATLQGADLSMADISEACLEGANLSWTKCNETSFCLSNLLDANLHAADLRKANLEGAILVNTNLSNARLSGCSIYGSSVWNAKLDKADQLDLVVTPVNEPAITTDNLEVAQFIYLLLRNRNLRRIIDTIGKKVVLILGRFTPERKTVLNAIRNKLRLHGYVPVLFDFPPPTSRDFTETISTLAHMARFIIADLTEPSSIAKELEVIVPTLAVPVQPLLEDKHKTYSMFKDYWKYHWVLKVHRYRGWKNLMDSFETNVIAPAESKAKTLEKQRKLAMYRS